MIAQGFRFEIYDVANGWFQLQQPFAQSGNADAGTWTFRQEAPPSTIEITAAVIRDLLTIVEVAMPKHLGEQMLASESEGAADGSITTVNYQANSEPHESAVTSAICPPIFAPMRLPLVGNEVGKGRRRSKIWL